MINIILRICFKNVEIFLNLECNVSGKKLFFAVTTSGAMFIGTAYLIPLAMKNIQDTYKIVKYFANFTSHVDMILNAIMPIHGNRGNL